LETEDSSNPVSTAPGDLTLAAALIMVHPDTELRFIGPDIGFGVVATRLIPQGTIIWVQDALDQVLTPEQVRSLGPIYANVLTKYTFVNVRGEFVRAVIWRDTSTIPAIPPV